MIVMVVTLAMCIYLFVTFNVNPVLKMISEEKVKALTTLAINASVQNVMGENFDYKDMIQVTKDASGDVSLIQVNSTLVNTIARKTVIDSQELISSMGEQGIKIPIGSLSGMSIFAGKGPDFNIKVYPVGSITSVFDSSFISVGINQMRHLIKMIVFSNVNVIIPGVSQTIATVTEILLCENIIVGKIPEVYLQSNSITEMLDLIPR